jgi:hypothetical protein
VNNPRFQHLRASRFIVAGAALLMSASMACHAPAVGAQPAGAVAAPDFSLSDSRFAADDAVILRRVQHWTLDPDGTLHRRDHQWVRLHNSRPIRRYGDPRIDFVHGRDELIIHTAQSHLPDGTVLPVPDYSFNTAAPGDVGRWPEYADWQQRIVSFSGIEDNVVLELDYEIVTPAGSVPWVEADLRLNDDYPTVERVVSVTLPDGTTLAHQAGRTDAAKTEYVELPSAGSVTHQWTFRDLDGTRGEAQSPRWERRCGRLRFTTAPNASAWTSVVVDRIENAGQPDEAVKRFAEAVVEDEAVAIERVRKVAKKLHDSFNFINSDKATESLTCRGAAEVLRANYGNRLESAALLLSALRSLGMTASPAVGVDAQVWRETDEVPPTASSFAGAVVVVDLPDGPVYVHPQNGVFKNPGSWGRHWLLSMGENGSLERTYVYARGEKEPGTLHIAGKVSIETGGEATGELRFRATGGFYDPGHLETSDAQKALVKNFVGRVLTGFDVPGHSVTTLSDELFRATASVSSNGAVEKFGKQHMVQLGDGPAFLPDVPMPLAISQRRTDVQLAGRFEETVDLTIELPEGWRARVTPGSIAPVQGTWGAVSQTVESDGRTIRLRREVRVTQERLSPSDFAVLRRGVNDLRATKSLLLVFDKEGAAGDES